jgi:hypothetical protein
MSEGNCADCGTLGNYITRIPSSLSPPFIIQPHQLYIMRMVYIQWYISAIGHIGKVANLLVKASMLKSTYILLSLRLEVAIVMISHIMCVEMLVCDVCIH